MSSTMTSSILDMYSGGVTGMGKSEGVCGGGSHPCGAMREGGGCHHHGGVSPLWREGVGSPS